MNLITDYWQQLMAFVTLVYIISVMRVDISTLKEKVKTLYDLWNQKK